jgi:hypothetical protein
VEFLIVVVALLLGLPLSVAVLQSASLTSGSGTETEPVFVTFALLIAGASSFAFARTYARSSAGGRLLLRRASAFALVTFALLAGAARLTPRHELLNLLLAGTALGLADAALLLIWFPHLRRFWIEADRRTGRKLGL